jgi:hypothetical protein
MWGSVEIRIRLNADTLHRFRRERGQALLVRTECAVDDIHVIGFGRLPACCGACAQRHAAEDVFSANEMVRIDRGMAFSHEIGKQESHAHEIAEMERIGVRRLKREEAKARA